MNRRHQDRPSPSQSAFSHNCEKSIERLAADVLNHPPTRPMSTCFVKCTRCWILLAYDNGATGASGAFPSFRRRVLVCYRISACHCVIIYSKSPHGLTTRVVTRGSERLSLACRAQYTSHVRLVRLLNVRYQMYCVRGDTSTPLASPATSPGWLGIVFHPRSSNAHRCNTKAGVIRNQHPFM